MAAAKLLLQKLRGCYKLSRAPAKPTHPGAQCNRAAVNSVHTICCGQQRDWLRKNDLAKLFLVEHWAYLADIWHRTDRIKRLEYHITGEEFYVGMATDVENVRNFIEDISEILHNPEKPLEDWNLCTEIQRYVEDCRVPPREMADQNGANAFLNLPSEIILSIVEYLGPVEWTCLRATCRNLRNAMHSERVMKTMIPARMRGSSIRETYLAIMNAHFDKRCHECRRPTPGSVCAKCYKDHRYETVDRTTSAYGISLLLINEHKVSHNKVDVVSVQRLKTLIGKSIIENRAHASNSRGTLAARYSDEIIYLQNCIQKLEK